MSRTAFTECAKRAAAWMQSMGITEIFKAKRMLNNIIQMCPDEKSLSSVEIIAGGRRIKLDAAFRKRAKDIMTGLQLLEKGYGDIRRKER